MYFLECVEIIGCYETLPSGVKTLSSRSWSSCLSWCYWPSVRSRWLDIGQVLFCVFMDRDEVKVTKNAPPKKRAQYPAILTEQVWSIKYLLYGLKVTPKNFAFSKTKQEILSGQDRPILPARVANQNTGFASSCLLRGASHIIRQNMTCCFSIGSSWGRGGGNPFELHPSNEILFFKNILKVPHHCHMTKGTG